MDDEKHGDSGIGEDNDQGGGTDPLHGQGGEVRVKERATPPLEDQGDARTQVDALADEAGGQRGGEDRPGA